MKRSIRIVLGFAICFCGLAAAQNGPVTSNLKNILVYFYGYSSDHANTPEWCGYLMKLGSQHGFTVDTTSNSAAFTTANLANYQAIALYNAYDIGQQMSAAQKDALRSWYRGNRGMACFHQCVKNSWGGTYPDWYDSLMGVQYLTWAGYGTGPVYVDSDVVGTDLAMSSDGSAYPVKYTMSWYDEWYTYVSSPATLPGTKMMWTTRTSAFNFSGTNEFNISGDVQPIAWARAVQGGRFVLNSMFHSDSARISTNPQLRQFIDGAVLGILRYVAGYTGCMDSTYREYNPKATDSGTGACVNKITTSIRVGGFGNGGPVKADHLGIAFTQPGPHSLQVFDSRGRRVFIARGQGAHTYRFDGFKPGVYFLNARSGRDTFNHTFLLL